MKTRVILSLVACATAALAIPGLDLAGPPAGPQIITFDVPGAGTGSQQGTGCFGCTFAINQWGAIAGTYTDAAGTPHGFLRSPDGKSFTTIDFPVNTPGDFLLGTWAQGINDWGEITGYYLDLDFSRAQIVVAHGFVRTPEGVFTSFDVLTGAIPVYINIEGATVGYTQDANGLDHAFLRHPNGTVSVFVGPNSCTPSSTGPACYGNEATYVDLFGGSIGNFTDTNFVSHGMIRSPTGKLTTFDAPGAGTNGPFLSAVYQGTGCPGCNLGVNFWGEIAGIYIDDNYSYHTFLRSPDGRFFTKIDVPGAGTGFAQGTGCNSDCPVGLNDEGEITGTYVDSSYYHHGFLRTADGSFVKFDPSGSFFTQPESINDAGTIVGYYNDNVVPTGILGVYHGFVVITR